MQAELHQMDDSPSDERDNTATVKREPVTGSRAAGAMHALSALSTLRAPTQTNDVSDAIPPLEPASAAHFIFTAGARSALSSSTSSAQQLAPDIIPPAPILPIPPLLIAAAARNAALANVRTQRPKRRAAALAAAARIDAQRIVERHEALEATSEDERNGRLHDDPSSDHNDNDAENNEPQAKKQKMNQDGRLLCPYKNCSSTLKNETTLKRHIALHTNPTHFPCTHPGCTKTLTRRHGVKKHLLTHKSERKRPRLQCPKCTHKKFTGQSGYFYHLKTQHPHETGMLAIKIR
jgi:hypothetical protein